VTAVWVTKEGFSEKRLTYAAGQSPVESLQIRLERYDTGIYGKVTDFQGNPATRFMMIFTDVDHPDRGPYFRQFQADDGKFMVNDIPAGVYDLLIQCPMPDSVQNLRITSVELKKGYVCGEMDAQLKVVAMKKNETD
jgi:hypothetical protein